MKKVLVIIGALLLLGSCVPLKQDGSFGREIFVGKFRGISIYKVTTPSGMDLYLGINENNKLVSTEYSTGGKSSTHTNMIIEDVDIKMINKEGLNKEMELINIPTL